MTAESAEFADYLTMENFFNAETSAMAQQNYPQGSAAPSHNGDYLMAPLENTYNYENSMDQQSHHPEKFDFHNNNNNVQYFYDNANSVQNQQILSQHPPEYFVSTSASFIMQDSLKNRSHLSKIISNF